MSTLQTTFLKHPDAAGNQITFTSGGDVNFDNGAVYLDSTNNRLGVGTTSPGVKLEVNCGTDNGAAEFVSTDARVNIGFADNGTTLYSGLSGVRVGADGDNLALYTANSESARIDSSGRLLVGTSSSSFSSVRDKLVVETSNSGNVPVAFKNIGGAGAEVVDIWNATGSGNNAFVNFFTETSVTTRGTIDYNRSVGQVRYNTTSDRRLKSNIKPSASALADLSAIQVRSYKWIETNYLVEHGFIAQELHDVVPDAVKQGDDGEEITDTWAVDNSKLVPLLTKALQEAIAKIEVLETKVAALESA